MLIYSLFILFSGLWLSKEMITIWLDGADCSLNIEYLLFIYILNNYLE